MASEGVLKAAREIQQRIVRIVLGAVCQTPAPMTEGGTGTRPPSCPDCDDAAKYAYSDATTPGFFSPKCPKHRPVASVEGQRTGEVCAPCTLHEPIGDDFACGCECHDEDKASPELEKAIREVYASRPERESSVPGVEGMGAREWLASRGLADLSLYWPTNKPIPQIDYASGQAKPSLEELMEAYARSLRGAGGERETDGDSLRRRFAALKNELDLLKISWNSALTGEDDALRGLRASESREQAMRECLRYSVAMIGSVLKSGQCSIGPDDTKMLQDSMAMAEKLVKP